MIDWHSHILPEIDDGSRSTAESISLITAQLSQGVKTVVATPHFDPNFETVDSFLKRREKSFEKLKEHLPPNAPEIVLGAEVRFYAGISRMEKLKALKAEGSNILLLEMPMSYWTEYTVRELIEMSGKSDIKIVLAHVERYFNFQNYETWKRLYENGILMQANASFFTSFQTKRTAVSLLKHGNIHLIGSDCHNMISRPPKMDKAFKIIEKKLGKDICEKLNRQGYSLLKENS